VSYSILFSILMFMLVVATLLTRNEIPRFHVPFLSKP